MEAYTGSERLFVLSETDISRIIEQAVSACISKGLTAGGTAAGTERKPPRKKNILHNISALLRNYRVLKMSVDNAVYDIKQMEQEEPMRELISMMLNKEDREEIKIESIRKSAAKTTIMIRHINEMVEIYGDYCRKSSDSLDMRRYEILMDKYIRGEDECSVEDLADKYFVTAKTVYRDLGMAKEKIAALIFGVDGIRAAAK